MAYFRTPEEAAPELGITPTTLRLVCKNTGFCTRLERRHITLTQADIERVLEHLAVEQEKKTPGGKSPNPIPSPRSPMEDLPQLPEHPERIAYTVEQAASAVGVSKDIIRAHIKRGNLVARYPSSRPIISAQELGDWLEALPTEPPES